MSCRLTGTRLLALVKAHACMLASVAINKIYIAFVRSRQDMALCEWCYRLCTFQMTGPSTVHTRTRMHAHMHMQYQ